MPLRPRRLPIAAGALALIAASLLAFAACSDDDDSSDSASADGPPTVSAPATEAASGLQIIDVEVGDGTEAAVGTFVTVHYSGWLDDGTLFDTSLDGDDPFTIPLGAEPRAVIQGWEEGLLGMKAGGKRRLIIPPELAYGDTGYGDLIGPGETLTFDIELLEVQDVLQ